jgi:competence protein ComEC
VALWVASGCLAGAVVLVARRRATSWIWVGVLVGVAAAATSGGIRSAARALGPLPGLARDGAVVEVVVQLSSDPVAKTSVDPANGHRYGYVIASAQATEVMVDGRRWVMRQPVLLLAHDQSWVGLLPSQRVWAIGKLSPPRPGDASITAVVAVRGPPELRGEASAVQQVAGKLRAGLRTASGGLPWAAGGLLPGLVDGDTSGLPDSVAADFRTTGLTHLVAVSGTNVAIVASAVMGLVRRARAGPRLSAVLAGLSVVGFVVLARPSGSVLRAAVMGLLGLLGVVLSRPRPAFTGLCAAVLVLLLLNPEMATEPGFALSVLATLGILTLAPSWTRLLHRRMPRPIAEAIAIPAAAQCACAPVIALIGGGLSLIAVPANLLAAPAVAPATLLGVVAAALAPLAPFLARWCADAASLPCLFLLSVAHVGARIPYASVRWPDGAKGALLLVVGSVGLALAVRLVVSRLAHRVDDRLARFVVPAPPAVVVEER